MVVLPCYIGFWWIARYTLSLRGLYGFRVHKHGCSCNRIGLLRRCPRKISMWKAIPGPVFMKSSYNDTVVSWEDLNLGPYSKILCLTIFEFSNGLGCSDDQFSQNDKPRLTNTSQYGVREMKLCSRRVEIVLVVVLVLQDPC